MLTLSVNFSPLNFEAIQESVENQMVYLTRASAHINIHNTVHKTNAHISMGMHQLPVLQNHSSVERGREMWEEGPLTQHGSQDCFSCAWRKGVGRGCRSWRRKIICTHKKCTSFFGGSKWLHTLRNEAQSNEIIKVQCSVKKTPTT